MHISMNLCNYLQISLHVENKDVLEHLLLKKILKIFGWLDLSPLRVAEKFTN